MKNLNKKGRTRVIALLLSLCGTSFIALMCSIFAWFIPNNQLDNTHISGSLVRGYFHDANFGTEAKPSYSDGSKEKPYVITRPQHLYNLAHLQYEYVEVGDKKISFADQGYYFQIGWNLDKDDKNELEVYGLSGQISDRKVLDMGGMKLPPIGFVDLNATGATASTGDYSFKGSFNGNGFNIRNFTVDGSFTSGNRTYYPKNIGFFGEIAKPEFDISGNNKQVTNFTLSDVTINTHTGKVDAKADEKVNYVGYACGYVNEGKLSEVGIYRCKINCSSSYFRSNYTLIGEKNVANSSFAEDAPILDYAFDPNKFTETKVWKGNTNNLYKADTTSDSYSSFDFTTTSSTICKNGQSMNDHIFYKDSNGDYFSYSDIKNNSSKSSYIDNMLYDPRVFDVRGEVKTYKVTAGNSYDSTLEQTTIVSKNSNENSLGAVTDYNGNPIKIKINQNDPINTFNVGYNSDPNTKKFEYTCNGNGKIFFLFSPNTKSVDVLKIYKKNNNIFEEYLAINVNPPGKDSVTGYVIPIELEEGESSATFRMGLTQNNIFRIIYLRFMMQSEFGNTGSSGSVESVDYTYETLEIPGSEGFTLSRITIRFDSTSKKDVIIVVTREISNSIDEIKISNSIYVINGIDKNFTIINKASSGSNVVINYPQTG